MKLFYTTKEVADHLQINESKLSYYISEFKLNIKMVGRVRKYSHKDIEKLEQILDLTKESGFTLQGAKEQLKIKKQTTKQNNTVKEKLLDIKKTLQILQNAISD